MLVDHSVGRSQWFDKQMNEKWIDSFLCEAEPARKHAISWLF